jgi:SAM-dependent methyltransferase
MVSLAYERGWRQGFAWAGFPGVEEEFRYAMEYLRPQYGQMLVDVSCGSGLFSRRFAKSGEFSSVIASDFSESMLSQTYDYLQDDMAVDQSKVLLLRADVGRLPFKTGSVAAIHAGVRALVLCSIVPMLISNSSWPQHCWRVADDNVSPPHAPPQMTQMQILCYVALSLS